MADPRIEMFKRFALQQAAMQQPDMAASQMQGAPPQLGGASIPVNPQQPSPDTAGQPTAGNPGPIKSFLQSFLYGAGQGLLAKTGLETDAQKQQREFNQSQMQEQNRRLAQTADAMSLYRQQQANKLGEQADQLSDLQREVEVPNDPKYGQFAGQKMSNAAFQGLNKVFAGNQGKENVAQTKADVDREIAQLKYGNGETPGPLNTVFKDINGHSLAVNRKTLEVLKDFGPSNSIATAYARAAAQAQYGIVPTIDTEGNPTVTSRLDALKGGTPQVPFTQSRALTSDRVGIQQYEDILGKQIAPNLSVLNDNTQRAIIAETLAQGEKNPGALKSVLVAATQKGLSPQGAALAAGILQGREFGSVARKYGGNMNGTEGLMNRIISNQASPLNTEQLNRDLIQNDLAFTAKAKGALGGLTKRGVPSGNPAEPTPSAPSAEDPFSKYGGRRR